MGLRMSEKKALTNEIAQRYRGATKQGKKEILDEFCRTTGYHRKYAVSLLNSWGKKRIVSMEGKLVELVVGAPRKARDRGRGRVYDDGVYTSLREIWKYFDYQCGKRLVVLLRNNMEVLKAQPEFAVDETVACRLTQISAATVDRLLKSERKRLEIKGRSHTKHGPLLKHEIPVRTHYNWDERLPGFFEIDRVHHDGGNASGEFCASLTATDVYSGWVELRPQRNRAHRWAKESIVDIRFTLPFPLLGIDSDNGGEFINHALYDYCRNEGIEFTRGRAYRKNDNCFVEQKNDMAVRRTVGYYRFTTEAEYEALQEVYRHLCPLLNFYYASMKLIRKERTGAKIRKVYDDPKPPYKRLLDSPHVSDEIKDELRRRAASLHIVEQKRLVDKAVARLLAVHREKNQESLTFPGSSINEHGKNS
jgi:hypothetical protein